MRASTLTAQSGLTTPALSYRGLYGKNRNVKNQYIWLTTLVKIWCIMNSPLEIVSLIKDSIVPELVALNGHLVPSNLHALSKG